MSDVLNFPAPAKDRSNTAEPRAVPPAYAEFAVTTNFSFLRGASHPEELVEQAVLLGHSGIGIADRNSVAGVVRAHVMAKERKLKLAVGARLVFADGTPDILAYPSNRAAWGRLTRLLSLGKRRAEKGDCILNLPDLLDRAEGLNLIVMPPARIDAARLSRLIAQLTQHASKRSVWLAAGFLYRGDDHPPAAQARADRARWFRSADRHQRRALSCARAPHAAGRRHLHPRACHASTRPGGCCRSMPNAI